MTSGAAFANGDVSLEVVIAATTAADQQRRELRAKLAEPTATTAAPPLPRHINAELWGAFTGEAKADILDTVVERVVIPPAGNEAKLRRV